MNTLVLLNSPQYAKSSGVNIGSSNRIVNSYGISNWNQLISNAFGDNEGDLKKYKDVEHLYHAIDNNRFDDNNINWKDFKSTSISKMLFIACKNALQKQNTWEITWQTMKYMPAMKGLTKINTI